MKKEHYVINVKQIWKTPSAGPVMVQVKGWQMAQYVEIVVDWERDE